jgi:hypothetical protein
MYMNDICTIPTNLAGHPAMSVPFGSGDDGLPDRRAGFWRRRSARWPMFRVAAVARALGARPATLVART